MFTDIAHGNRIADVDYSEDMDWAMRISRDVALRGEALVYVILYHYDSRRRYAWQWLLDKTQAVGHAFGLRRVNQLAVSR